MVLVETAGLAEGAPSSDESMEIGQKVSKSSPATPIKRKSSGGSVSWGSSTPKSRRGNAGVTPVTSLPAESDSLAGQSSES